MNSTSLRRECGDSFQFRCLLTSYKLPIESDPAVLRSFKNLHRARCSVFRNNNHVLESARKEINDGYRKNINVKNEESIKELIKFADEVAVELRTSVAELEEIRPGHFRLKLRPEMFNECKKELEQKGKKNEK